jgi:hypothetical protein
MELTIDDDFLNGIDWDALIRDVQAEWKAKKLRRDNPYHLDLNPIRSLHQLRWDIPFTQLRLDASADSYSGIASSHRCCERYS